MGRSLVMMLVLIAAACALQASDVRGRFTVCPFGWCEGQSDGDTGDSGGTGPGGELRESAFLSAFSESYCDKARDCWDTVGTGCEDATVARGEACSGYDAGRAHDCLDAFARLDECWELDEGDWIAPCMNVYDEECGQWWYRPEDRRSHR